MNIQFKELNKKMPVYKQVKKLYKTAFPREERAPFVLMTSAAKRGNGEFLIAFDGDEFVGLAYMVCSDALAYIFYLAVSEDKRSKGYGGAVLSALKERYKGRKLFLALEAMDESAPNIEQRRKRRSFYEKNGFEGVACKLKEATVVYDVMSIGGTVTAAEYDKLITGWCGRFIKTLADMRIIENA